MQLPPRRGGGGKAGSHNNWSAAAAMGAAPGRHSPPAAPSSQFPETARRQAAPVAPCQLLLVETRASLSKKSGRSHPHPRAVASRGRRLARAGPSSACPRPLRVEARGVPRAGGRPVPDSLARVEGRASPGTNSTRAWPGRGGIGNRDWARARRRRSGVWAAAPPSRRLDRQPSARAFVCRQTGPVGGPDGSCSHVWLLGNPLCLRTVAAAGPARE